MKKKIWKFFGYGNNGYVRASSRNYNSNWYDFVEGPIRRVASIAEMAGVIMLAMLIAHVGTVDLKTALMFTLIDPVWSIISACIRVTVYNSWKKEDERRFRKAYEPGYYKDHKHEYEDEE